MQVLSQREFTEQALHKQKDKWERLEVDCVTEVSVLPCPAVLSISTPFTRIPEGRRASRLNW